MLRKSFTLLAVLLVPALCAAQYDETSWPVDTVGSPAPSFTRITANQTWLSGHVIHLQGFVAVDSGVTLTIQPGTIVKGEPGQAANATVLIMGPGSKLMAQGTSALPIVFTSWLDMVGDTSDIPDVASSRGLWGGIVMCGRGYTCAAGGQSIMEGIPDSGRICHYGGGLSPDCSDNKGILQYISIRYAGSIFAANVEVNALSLGAVGDGTTIDHIDTYYGLDDDIEFWGGNVNVYYFTSFYGDDDCWDTDECWTGVRQFGFEVKDPRWGDRLSETDGRQSAAWSDTTSAGVAPSAVPSGWGCNYPSYGVSLNVTAIGQGQNFTGTDGNRQLFRENYRGYWYNNIFMEQPKTAVDVDCPGGDGNIDAQPSTTRNLPSGAASIAAGHPLFDMAGNFWYKSYNLPSGTGTSLDHFVSTGGGPLAIARIKNDFFPGGDTTMSGKNFLMNPNLTSYETVNPPVRHHIIDAVPAAGGNAAMQPATAIPGYVSTNHGGAIKPANFIGAFEPGKKMWALEPYVAANQYGILANGDTCGCTVVREGKPVVAIGTPAPSFTRITVDRVLHADTIYHLQGFCAVDSGVTLYIEPGTTIKSDPGQAANASVLIIGPGARIIAPGTKCKPIIFTSTLDDVDNPNDIPDVASSRGLWGGLVICGRGYTCAAGGQSIMEGIPDSGRICHYGGGLTPDCNDNSGILQYISIRYAGSIFAANVEVNALSLGAVGDGTIIDHIETFYGLDDDIELWGGNVNLYYLASFYGDDDCWDTDECWTGVRQFGLEVKDPRWGDRLSETDGRQSAAWSDTTSAGVAPSAVPSGWGCNYPSYGVNLNLTAIGQGQSFTGTDGNRQLFRENYRGYWYNNIFMEQPKTAVDVDCPGGDGNIDAQPSTTRNLPSGAASIAAGHPLFDIAGNFWYKSYNLPSGTGTSLDHFVSTGGGPLAIARIKNDFFPGGDTTMSGKNFLMNPELCSYETVNPPVRHAILNPVPKAGGNAATKAATAIPGYVSTNHGGAIVPTTYVGGFDPSVSIEDSWIWGWTAVSTCYGILGNTCSSGGSCCLTNSIDGRTGNVDGDPGKGVDISDLSALIDYLYISFTPPVCPLSANTDGDIADGIDISDLSALIDYLYISFTPCAVCH